MSVSNDLTSPSKEGGLSLANANSDISSSTPITLGSDLEAWGHMTSLPMGSVNTLNPEEKTSVQEEEIVDYGRQLVALTSRCTISCRPIEARLTSGNSGQFLSALFGKYVVNRGDVITSQKIGVAALKTTFPFALHDLHPSAIAEWFAAFYMQWHWWNERTDFTTPELIDLGKAAKASFETVQLHIAKLENSARKEVGKLILNCLDFENG